MQREIALNLSAKRKGKKKKKETKRENEKIKRVRDTSTQCLVYGAINQRVGTQPAAQRNKHTQVLFAYIYMSMQTIENRQGILHRVSSLYIPFFFLPIVKKASRTPWKNTLNPLPYTPEMNAVGFARERKGDRERDSRKKERAKTPSQNQAPSKSSTSSSSSWAPQSHPHPPCASYRPCSLSSRHAPPSSPPSQP